MTTTPSYESLSHSKWDCRDHIVFIPKERKKILYGKIRKFLGNVFCDLAKQRGSKMIEGHMVQDHVHMLIKNPSEVFPSKGLFRKQGQLDSHEGCDEQGSFYRAFEALQSVKPHWQRPWGCSQNVQLLALRGR